MYKLFIVEDDRGIAQGIKTQAELWGLETYIAQDLQHVTDEFLSVKPHLVLLDIVLPFYGGYYWCSQIRAVSKVPIIFISSASDNMSIVTAINMGGDDFVAKPFDLNVLNAKIQALLRRTYDFGSQNQTISHKGATLDTEACALIYNSQKIELTKNEFRILTSLIQNKGKTVSREKLMQALWETDQFVDENTLNVNVGRLRKKLASYGLDDFIATKFGIGYIVE